MWRRESVREGGMRGVDEGECEGGMRYVEEGECEGGRDAVCGGGRVRGRDGSGREVRWRRGHTVYGVIAGINTFLSHSLWSPAQPIGFCL